MKIKFIKTREGDIVDFDRSRIERVIEKAWQAVWKIDFAFVDIVTDNVIEALKVILETEWVITIEMIQDTIEKELMKYGEFDVMKEFIIYRAKRAEKRAKNKEKVDKKLEKKELKIEKSSWKKEDFSKEKVKNTYKIVSYWLARKCPFEEIYDSFKKYIVEWMKTSDITKMLIKSAVDLISV